MDEPTFNYDVEPPDGTIAEVWRARAELWEEFGDDWEARHAALLKLAEQWKLPPPVTLDNPMHPSTSAASTKQRVRLRKPPGKKKRAGDRSPARSSFRAHGTVAARPQSLRGKSAWSAFPMD